MRTSPGWSHDLSPATLVAAYKRGLFPKGHFGPLKWMSPGERCVLFFDEYHISRRIRSHAAGQIQGHLRPRLRGRDQGLRRYARTAAGI